MKKTYNKSKAAYISIIAYLTFIRSPNVGKFDPITREKLDPSKLVPNLAIKEAVAAYLERHVWAYKVGS
ncbi:unnamed protein product [Brassica rapa subsp. trilocularis]